VPWQDLWVAARNGAAARKGKPSAGGEDGTAKKDKNWARRGLAVGSAGALGGRGDGDRPPVGGDRGDASHDVGASLGADAGAGAGPAAWGCVTRSRGGRRGLLGEGGGRHREQSRQGETDEAARS